jgi:CMP-N,N'-diacetyllegionaminic acid synthase
MSQNFIALVPARGGSKGLARKNLRELAGKPLLNHAIDAARGSRNVAAIYISSEDEEILATGARAGCKTIQRPAALARDDSTATEVMRHFFETAALDGDPTIIYLQPTSPLRTSGHIDNAIGAMIAAGATSLVSVVELEKSPFKSFVCGEDGRLKSLFDEKFSNHNRQQLPKAYIPNGAIYIFTRSLFLARGGFPSEGSLPYIMSAADSVDIDTQADLDRAQKLMEQRNG